MLISIYLDNRMQKNLGTFKEAAYLDYFRAFSVGTMATIRKLQNAFKQQMSDNYFFDSGSMFKRVKTMLGTYEILILQINDSFQFVQIPEFGQCILKIFLQMMSIIRWLLKSMSLRPAFNQMQGKKHQRNTVSLTKPSQQFNDPKQIFKIKEKANFLLEDMKAQIFKMQQQQQHADSFNFGLNKQKFLKISSSDSQALIEQAVNAMVKNSQYLNHFVDLRQVSMKQNQHQNGIDMYNRIKSSFMEQSARQIQEIKKKMRFLFDEHLRNYELQKKSQMISQQIQVKIVQKNTVEQAKIKKLMQTIKSLENSNRILKSQNQSLQKLLEEKTMQFQNQMINYQMQKALETITLKSALSKKQSRINQKLQSKTYLGQKDKVDKKAKKQDEQHKALKTQGSQKQGLNRKTRHHNTSKDRRIRFQNEGSADGSLDNSSNQNQRLQIYSQTASANYKPSLIYQVRNSKQNKHKRQHSRSLLITNNISCAQGHQQKEIVQFLRVNKSPYFYKCQQAQTFLKQTDFKQTQTQSNLNLVKNLELTIQLPQQKSHSQNRISSLLKSIKNIGVKGQRNSEQNQSSSSEYLTRIQGNKNSFSYHNNIQKQIKQKLSTQIGENQFRNTNNQLYNKIFNYTAGCKVTAGNAQQPSNKHQFVLEEIKNIKFSQQDVWTIFFTQQNCKNYEIVNIYKEQAINKRASNSRNSLRKQKYRPSNANIRIGTNQHKKSAEFSFLISSTSLIFKQLTHLRKSNKQSYQEFRNFLRYPFSLFKHGNGKKWKQLVKQQDDLQSWEVQNKIGKMFRFHSNCPKIQISGQNICQHILNLYKKLGIAVKW